MFVSIHLRDDVAEDLARDQPNLPKTNQLLKLLTESRVHLQPLHPGIADPELRSQFYVLTDTDSEADRLVKALLSFPSVTAAYVRPPDAAP